MPNGNRTVLVDGVGNRTTWTFDLLNRVVAEQDAGGTATFAYDGAGQLASATDKLGRRRDFDYDLAGRKESEIWFTSGATVQLQTWTYDLAGRMTAARDPDGTYTYTYDRAGRVTQAQGPFGVTLTYGYDTAGNRTGVTDSTGVVTTVAFDAKNRQSSEAAAGGGSSATRFDYSYTDRGQVSAVKRYSDLAGTATVALSAYQYDDAMRLTALTHKSGAGVTLAHFTYAYDAADRLTGKTDNGTHTSYAYDDARQLTRDGAATFGYDAAGNRTNAGYATGAGNRISTDGVWTYTHDAEGNVTKRSKGASSDTWVYTYDHKNQLLTATLSATDGGTVTQRVTYAYDASGSRIQRQGWDGATATTERYALDGGDPAKPRALGNEYKDAVLVLDGSNAVVTRWAFGTGFAEVVASQNAAGTITWDLTDRQGSVRNWVNNSATLLATAVYDAYGNLTAGTIWDGIGYAGQPHDHITLLYGNGHGQREYLTAIGGWLQSDPRWPLTGEAHPFVYAKNSPTNFTDPSGMEPPGFVGPPNPNREVSYREKLAQELDKLKRERQTAVMSWHQDRLERAIVDLESKIAQQDVLDPAILRSLLRDLDAPGGRKTVDPVAEFAADAAKKRSATTPAKPADGNGLFALFDPIAKPMRSVAGSVPFKEPPSRPDFDITQGDIRAVGDTLASWYPVPNTVAFQDTWNPVYLVPSGTPTMHTFNDVRWYYQTADADFMSSLILGVGRNAPVSRGVVSGIDISQGKSSSPGYIGGPNEKLGGWDYTGRGLVIVLETAGGYGTYRSLRAPPPLPPRASQGGLVRIPGATREVFIHPNTGAEFATLKELEAYSKWLAAYNKRGPLALPPAPPRTAGYGTLTTDLEGTGLQAHHLNQNAAYKKNAAGTSIIPEDEGLSVGLRGNAFSEVGSPHYEAHSSMEVFWDQFRRGGARFGQTPTNAEYGQALERSLLDAGFSPRDAARVAEQAAEQRAAYGLAPNAPVPRIPRKIYQTPR